jgi:diadenosine tetraphosphate (Ap4A) HIT family hydrolase
MNEELVDGHCLIVPQQHCLSSLEMEDDDWEEVKVG